ncbi:MAG: TonB-dependent receptor [Bacteroidetes bacterium]|nr:TonB-dependent receptor [Bacteroidota bacterium]
MYSKLIGKQKRNLFNKLTTLTILFGFGCLQIFAQPKGSISGKVTDKSSGETLISATVQLVGTSRGALTDLDGIYIIKDLAPGKYTVKFTFISYQNVVVDNAIVEAGKDTKISVSLLPVAAQMSEVVVSADVLKSTEAAIVSLQKKSSSIVDGISAELIKKNNSSNVSDILKRMSGITMSEGKYAYIRGVSDRYNLTLLNGASLPSTDPEKKSVSYDLFPSSLIENIVTHKSSTPDSPADFSGGLVEINTIEFPAEFFMELGTGGSYNSVSTQKGSLVSQGGKYDFLGFDDGTRDLPSIIPNSHVNSSLGQEKIQELGRAFNNDWNVKGGKIPFNSNFKFSIGNSFEVGDNSLGFIGSLTYSNNSEIRNYTRNYYNYDGVWYDYRGSNYLNNVLWGALFNVSYKFSGKNKISFKNIYNQNTDNNVITTKGNHYYVPEYRDATSIQFLQRSLYSTQLIGEHLLSFLNNSLLNWNVNFANSKRKEPDTRKYWYSRDIDSSDNALRFAMNQATDTRFFSNLNDKTFGFSGDLLIKIFDNPSLPNLKVGYSFNNKDRDYDPRVFGFDFNQRKTSIALRDSIFKLPVEDIFRPENINPNFIYLVEVSNPPDKYSASEKLQSAFLMFNTIVYDKLKLTGGLRYEYSKTNLTYIDPQNYSRTLQTGNSYNDILPSLNFTYIVSDEINIRGAYGRTLTRPELRELAVSGYYDFLTDDYVFGNPDLVRTLIDNYDLRFEIYPAANEIFSINFFYKRFDKPIEVIGINTSNKSRSWKNADFAKSYGVEFEVRKNLNIISESLRPFSLIGNLSFIKSEVDLGNAAVGQAELAQNRPLQGQADFVLNAGLYYDNYSAGLSANLNYNVIGKKIVEVGVNQTGDIVSQPRHQIDFNFSKILLSNFTLKVAVKDLLAQDEVTIQETRFGEKTADRIKRGRIFSIGISYQLN